MIIFHRGAALALVSTVSLSLAACGDSSSSSPETASEAQPVQTQMTEEQPSETSAEETTALETTPSDFAGTGGEIVLGRAIEFEDFSVTIKSYSIITDYEGQPALKVIYDWTNTGEETNAPFTSFSLTGFQNGVETDEFVMSEQLDLSIGQSDVRPGATITDAEDAVAIVDMSVPLELELTEWISWNDVAYLHVIEDLNSL